MAESSGKTGISRRDLIKRSAIAGGVVWVAPAILAEPAAADTTYLGCTNCPTGQLYFLRWTSGGVCTNSNPNNSCLNDNEGEPPPSMAYPAGCGTTSNCCLITAGLVSVSGTTPTHTWVLDPGVNFCGGHAFGGNDCEDVTVVVTNNSPSAGFTTVTITKANMSHSDIAVCVTGSVVSGCPGCGA